MCNAHACSCHDEIVSGLHSVVPEPVPSGQQPPHPSQQQPKKPLTVFMCVVGFCCCCKSEKAMTLGAFLFAVRPGHAAREDSEGPSCGHCPHYVRPHGRSGCPD